MPFPEPTRKVGRWLGEAHDFGQAMCYWVLSEGAKPIVHSMVQPRPPDKINMPEMQEQVVILNRLIQDKLGSPATDNSLYIYDLNEEQDVEAPDHTTPEYVPIDMDSSIPEANEWDAEAYEKYL